MAGRNEMASTMAEGLAEAIDRLRSTPRAELRRFDESMRDRTFSAPPWFRNLSRIEPEDVHDVIDAAADRSGAALVLACHPNGRVREKALRTGDFTLDPHSLAILVLRCADWVPQVRDAADRAFADTWDRSSEDAKLAVLPLMWHLSREGSRLTQYVQAALDVYLLGIDPETTAHFRHPDQRVRRILAATAADRLPADRLQSLVMDEKDAPTARALARILLARPMDPDVLERLTSAPVGSVRADALAKLTALDPPRSERALRRALLDTNAIARSFAQHELLHRGVDVRSVYVELVDEGNAQALPGLCEMASPVDAARAASLVASTRAPEQLWGLRMLSRIGVEHGPPPARLVELVGSGTSRVRRLAARLLRGCTDEDVLAALCSFAEDHLVPGRQRVAVRHFLALDRFLGLRFALESLARAGSRSAVELLDGVMSSWNTSFSSPRATDLVAIEAALPAALVQLDRHQIEMVAISLKPYINTDGDELARLRADGLREIRQGLYGLEFDFLACDRAGHLAVFSAGQGPVPITALTRTEAEDRAVAAIDDLDPNGSAVDQPGASGDLSFWRRKAERGFFTYDWQDHEGLFLRQCSPTAPLTAGDVDLRFRPVQIPGYFATIDRTDLRNLGIACEPA